MRTSMTACLVLLLTGCAASGPVGPRQYLDEQTVATITVVSDPWVFSAKRPEALPTAEDRTTVSATSMTDRPVFGTERRDFLSVYAIDVNRMGDHRQYLAVAQSVPRLDRSGGQAPLVLEVEVAGRT